MTGEVYELVLERVGRKWITANERLHWAAKAKKVAQWRDMTAWQASKLGWRFPFGARVVCEMRFNTNRRRDPANWAPTAKAVLDGLVDAQVFPDDNAKYIEGPDMRLGECVRHDEPEQMIIRIFPRQGGPQ